MNEEVIRIAMWSGPRNISTAMMRAWENRADTVVVDEPFYACYLTHTGIVHPMQEEVLASQANNWQQVIDGELSRSLSAEQSIQYQKHMTHHMVDEVSPSWFASLRHAFLIRNPAEVVVSYSKKRAELSADDIGFRRQRELFEKVRALGIEPPVIESTDVLKAPRASLQKLCAALAVPFDSAMLSWPQGCRSSDGAWAPHWYQNVENSTGFAPYEEKPIQLSAAQQRVVNECLDDYHALAEYKIKP
ncbi:MAG: HAD family hydrolase [Gammaproteobacteria bacterium]|nr:HAD family hydrolase [Gammaproteobacteria bacterium]